MSDEIYYCVSNDINIENSNENNQSIWQLSLIKLPFAIYKCQAMITDKKSNHPKLMILGCINQTWKRTDVCFKYNLCDVMDSDRFNRFMIDAKQVYYLLYFFFYFFFLVLLDIDKN